MFTWQKIKRWPNSGKFWKSDNTTFDLPNSLETSAATNIGIVSYVGDLWRTTWKGEIPVGTTYYFALDIPATHELIGHSRIQTVYGGRIDDQFRVGGSWTTVEETITPHNLDEIDGVASVCSLLRVTGYTGGEERSNGITATPSAGAGRASASQTQVGALPRFDNNSTPIFIYTNESNDALDVIFELTFSERLK